MRTTILAASLVSAACGAPSVGMAPNGYQLIPGWVPMDKGPDGNSIFLEAPDGLIIRRRATKILQAAARLRLCGSVEGG